jgi:hypothetical protein
MTRKSYKFYRRHPSKRQGSLFPTELIKYLSVAIGASVVFLMAANPAWAVQTHDGAEGLVAHQIGHFLFVVGMGYLLFRLFAMRMTGAGWFEFKTFLWLLLIWNIMTFTGHWMNEFVMQEKFIKINSHTISFTIENFHDALYYLTRLDHLILVPSFAFLLIALRKWRAQQ